MARHRGRTPRPVDRAAAAAAISHTIPVEPTEPATEPALSGSERIGHAV
jgi:hypothetical protein